jgi:hypothetical protein
LLIFSGRRYYNENLEFRATQELTYNWRIFAEGGTMTKKTIFKGLFILLAASLFVMAGLDSIAQEAAAMTAQEAMDAVPVSDPQVMMLLKQLVKDKNGGAPFTDEEFAMLRRFTIGYQLAAIEADTLLSRALYLQAAGDSLSAKQMDILDRYAAYTSAHEKEIRECESYFESMQHSFEVGMPEAAPANDLCGGAEVIPGAGPFPYLTAVTADITDATETAGDPAPSCQASHSRSIWYAFTPATTASYTIQNCQGDGPTATTVADTVLAVYTSAAGCAGAWTQIACDDDSCTTLALNSTLSANLTAGTTYYILNWLYGTTAPTAGSTAVQIRVSQNLPPVNDQCGSALPLSLNIPLAGSMSPTATNDYNLSGAACFTGIG